MAGDYKERLQNIYLADFLHRIKIATQASNLRGCLFLFGGDEGDRTPDLLNAIQALSQLSYAPKSFTSDIIRKKVPFVNRFLYDA